MDRRKFVKEIFNTGRLHRRRSKRSESEEPFGLYFESARPVGGLERAVLLKLTAKPSSTNAVSTGSVQLEQNM